MKILLTGSTGFVGRTVTRRLLSEDHSLCLLVRDIEKMRSLFPDGEYDFISLKEADWTEQVTRWNPDVTIHLAAYFTGKSDIESAERLVESNLMFPIKLLCALKDTACKAFINTGTFAEYHLGNGVLKPNSLYAASKTALRPIIDYFHSISGWKWINVIFYTAYGRKNENKKVIDYLADAIGSEKPIGFSDGTQILDFIHVDDMASFYSRLLNRIDDIPDKEEFHLGTGKGHSIREAGMIMEIVYGEKLNADWGRIPKRPNDHISSVAPIANNIRLLDWKAEISLEEGIAIFRHDLEQS